MAERKSIHHGLTTDGHAPTSTVWAASPRPRIRAISRLPTTNSISSPG